MSCAELSHCTVLVGSSGGDGGDCSCPFQCHRVLTSASKFRRCVRYRLFGEATALLYCELLNCTPSFVSHGDSLPFECALKYTNTS